MAEKSRTVNIYNDKVKVTGWNDDDSNPKDNNPYDPCKRNYFLSTHKRFGNDDTGFPISTTREMQQQVFIRGTIIKRCGALRAISTQGSFKDSCKYIMREGTNVHPMDYFITDYTTTTNYDYRHPNPSMEKPREIDLSPPPPIYGKVSYCGKMSQAKFHDEDLCKAVKCYPDHKKLPPYVYEDMYYGLDGSNKTNVVNEGRTKTCPTSEDGSDEANTEESKKP